ncbi:Vacuolar fusion protein mon1, partial [Apiotrichum porosum]
QASCDRLHVERPGLDTRTPPTPSTRYHGLIYISVSSHHRTIARSVGQRSRVAWFALSVSAPSVASASGVSLQSGGSRKGKERADPSLYLFAVSDWGEPEYVLRMHLEYIYLQILSVVTATQISRAFQRRSNFDLSRLLEGSDPFLHKLWLSPLRMAPALRDTAASALMPPAKFKTYFTFYLLLRPHCHAPPTTTTRRPPVRHASPPQHAGDVGNPALRGDMLPICLPKFNPAGFVHAYISFVREDVGLVFISADRDAFEPLCGWRESVVEQLTKDGALDRIQASVKAHPYSVAAVGSPGLRHFVYKSRGLTQLTAPEWEDPYGPDSADRKRLVTLYERVQDTLFARSGQAAPLKLVYMANAHEAVLGWLTKPFELYIAVSPHLPMNAVVSTANRVANR